MLSKIKNLKIGNYLTICACLLALILTIVYPICYAKTTEMSWILFVIIILMTLCSIFAIITNKYTIMQNILFILSLLSIVLFISSTFDYMVDAFVGIDVTNLSTQFILILVFVVLQFIINLIANIFETK